MGILFDLAKVAAPIVILEIAKKVAEKIQNA